jgi:uncharacterized tellurite resistance protein B-like protein
MLAHIKRLFAPEPVPDHAPHELHLAAGALLIEAARLDGHFDARERDTVARVLREKFALSPDETQDLIAAAEQKVEASTQLFEFTRVIARHFSPEERIELVEMLCEVMYADGALHDLEASLLRRVGELVYVSDRDRGAARRRVMQRLGIA